MLIGFVLVSFLLLLWWPLSLEEKSSQAWFFYDNQGALLYQERISGGEGVEGNAFFRQAIVALEDQNFYHHKGVDFKAVVRAMRQNIGAESRISGASTISMQLARLKFLESEPRNWWYKIRQTFYAFKLEQQLTKEAILDAYLARINFGSGAVGLTAAAERYFSKTPDQLSVLESVVLLAIVPNPTAFNPMNQAAVATERQQLVLSRLAQTKVITPQEYEFWRQKLVVLQPGAKAEITAPHFVFWLKESLADLSLESEEVHVYTTLNKSAYQASLKILRATLERLGPEKHLSNGAIVVLDKNNRLEVMLGSADFFDADISGAINMALAPRQTGSVLKPLLFALAIDQGWSPLEGLRDLKTIFPSGYLPRNFDIQEENGIVRFREALANSYNIAAVDLLQRVGVEPFYQFLQALGLGLRLPAEEYGLSLILGSAEASLFNLTQSFSVLTHQGELKNVKFLRRIEDEQGRILFTPPPQSVKSILSRDGAEWGQQVLSDKVARWKNFSRGNSLELPFPSGAKTGTSQGFRDNWVIGFSPRYTVGVWVGNADGKPMQSSSGMQGAGPVWQGVMQHLHPEFSPDFSYQGERALVSVCRRPGETDCAEKVTAFVLEKEQQKREEPLAKALAVEIFYPRSGDVFASGSEVLLQWRGGGEAVRPLFKLDGVVSAGPIFSELEKGTHRLLVKQGETEDWVEIRVQ